MTPHGPHPWRPIIGAIVLTACIGAIIIVDGLVGASWRFILTATLAVAATGLAIRLVVSSATARSPVRTQKHFDWPEDRETHDALRAWWRANGGPASAPVAEEAIAAFESRHGLRFPDDFRAYLLNASPVAEDMDDEGTAWWPFDRLRTLPEECPGATPSSLLSGDDARCVVFADYLIWCWAWGICCVPGEHYGKIIVVGGDDRFVADSFTAFVRQYARDWSSVC